MIKFKDLAKNQSGSITLYVIISCLFIIVITTGIYMSTSNKVRQQETELARIQQSYTMDPDNLYEKALEKNKYAEEMETIDEGLVNQSNIIDYNDNLDTINNPERGFYRPVNVIINNSTDLFVLQNGNEMSYECEQAKNDNINIIHLKVNLGQLSGNVNSSGNDRNLSNTQISSLNTVLNEIRKMNLTVILRFCYDTNGETNKEPKSFETIKNHIGQLNSFFNTNKDIIITLEAGFLGPKGEMTKERIIQK